MPMRRRQIRSQRPSAVAPIIKKAADAVVSNVKPIARTIKSVGGKAVSGYLGATNKLANKIISKLPPQKNISQPSRKPRRR